MRFQKARKRGMSVKRKHQRIQTGVKMVGVKPLDDLFKNAVIPLAECIQLRNALETATVRWLFSSGVVTQEKSNFYTKL